MYTTYPANKIDYYYVSFGLSYYESSNPLTKISCYYVFFIELGSNYIPN